MKLRFTDCRWLRLWLWSSWCCCCSWWCYGAGLTSLDTTVTRIQNSAPLPVSDFAATETPLCSSVPPYCSWRSRVITRPRPGVAGVRRSGPPCWREHHVHHGQGDPVCWYTSTRCSLTLITPPYHHHHPGVGCHIWTLTLDSYQYNMFVGIISYNYLDLCPTPDSREYVRNSHL